MHGKNSISCFVIIQRRLEKMKTTFRTHVQTPYVLNKQIQHVRGDWTVGSNLFWLRYIDWIKLVSPWLHYPSICQDIICHMPLVHTRGRTYSALRYFLSQSCWFLHNYGLIAGKTKYMKLSPWYFLIYLPLVWGWNLDFASFVQSKCLIPIKLYS